MYHEFATDMETHAENRDAAVTDEGLRFVTTVNRVAARLVGVIYNGRELGPAGAYLVAQDEVEGCLFCQLGDGCASHD